MSSADRASADAELRLGPARDADAVVMVLHGVGSTPEAVAPLAHAIARSLPRAAVVVPRGTAAFDRGSVGRQWFSIAGVTEGNRPARVAAALPALEMLIDAELERFALDRRRLAVVGFSQGAMMTLALATGPRPPALAAALAGRLTTSALPTTSPHPAVLIAHGVLDSVVPVSCAYRACETLGAAGFDVRLNLAPRLGHQVSQAQVHDVVEHLAPLAALSLETAAYVLRR